MDLRSLNKIESEFGQLIFVINFDKLSWKYSVSFRQNETSPKCELEFRPVIAFCRNPKGPNQKIVWKEFLTDKKTFLISLSLLFEPQTFELLIDRLLQKTTTTTTFIFSEKSIKSTAIFLLIKWLRVQDKLRRVNVPILTVFYNLILLCSLLSIMRSVITIFIKPVNKVGETINKVMYLP